MTTAVITCAGNGSRFGTNKLLEKLVDKPLVVHTIEKFQKSKKIDEIVAVVKKENISLFKKLFKEHNLDVSFAYGGEKRYLSAFNGVKKSNGKYILVHDGARPLVSVKLIDKIVDEVMRHGAVMAAFEPLTCIKEVKGGFILNNLCRSQTCLGQTPQAFLKTTLEKAYKNGIENNLSGMDDCELVSEIGVKVKVVRGEYNNFKVTMPIDLAVAKYYLEQERESANV